ncbi:MAG: HAD family phosphatase [Selenomonadaceae bacterium]|nr:HAD family phosphatase [Selenomonadaceae bacterium]MBQ9496156.1 HAD family phosphatase [Selenomonadaceae bacterium]
MIKIIFCDMDGTLLTSENKLPAGFDETVAELKRRGVIFSPASGRQIFSLKKSFANYADEFLFLAENGTLVTYRGEEIFSCPLGFEPARKVLAASMSFGNILRVYCGKNDAYILREQNRHEFKAELDKYYTHAAVADSFDEIDDVPLKVALFDPTAHSKENIYDKLTPFYDSLQVVLSSDYWVDVMAPNISKGEAVKNVQRVMNFKPEECAAFGDYLNDKEMLEAVGYGFAMANAHPALKKVARFETAGNDEAGVLVGIRRLMADGLI